MEDETRDGWLINAVPARQTLPSIARAGLAHMLPGSLTKPTLPRADGQAKNLQPLWGRPMRGARRLQRSWGGLIPMAGVLLAIGAVVLAASPLSPLEQPFISETDVSPHSRPLTFAQLLDEYLARLQEKLKEETRFIQESGLAEVKLTIRRDGSVTFSEIVVLDGPAALRHDLLPLVQQLGPLPPPPVDADVLDVSLLLPLQYPGSDLLDALEQEP